MKYNQLRKADLLTGKAYSMKENIMKKWNVSTILEAEIYFEKWYSWIVHSSVDAMKDASK